MHAQLLRGDRKPLSLPYIDTYVWQTGQKDLLRLRRCITVPLQDVCQISGLSCQEESYFQHFIPFKHHFPTGMLPSWMPGRVQNPLQRPPSFHWKLWTRRSTCSGVRPFSAPLTHHDAACDSG